MPMRVCAYIWQIRVYALDTRIFNRYAYTRQIRIYLADMRIRGRYAYIWQIRVNAYTADSPKIKIKGKNQNWPRLKKDRQCGERYTSIIKSLK